MRIYVGLVTFVVSSLQSFFSFRFSFFELPVDGEIKMYDKFQ